MNYKPLFKAGDRVCLQSNQEDFANVLYYELRPPHGYLYFLKRADGSKFEALESELMLKGVIWREQFRTFSPFTESPGTKAIIQ